jgi:hypothetical protein
MSSHLQGLLDKVVTRIIEKMRSIPWLAEIVEKQVLISMQKAYISIALDLDN